MITNEVEILLNQVVDDIRCGEVVVDSLHAMGYNYNFELVGNKLLCLQTGLYYFPRDFEVDQVYCFDSTPMGIEGYYLYSLRDSSGPVGIFTAYPVKDAANKKDGS